MKHKTTRIAKRFVKIVPALAMMLAIQSVSSTCFFCVHQPDVPEELM